MNAYPADSFFADNRRVAGTSTGARGEFADIDASFLEMVGTRVSAQPVELERDPTKRNDLQIIPGTPGADLGAGLFTKKAGE